MTTIAQKLQAFRIEMEKEGYGAYLVTGTDPHRSEYTAPRWRTREFISGFTGSAGTVVVTASKAGLWTDSRYYLQAEMELAGTGILLFKEEEPGVPSPQAWVAGELAPGQVLGTDGTTTPWNTLKAWSEALEPQGLKIAVGPDLLDRFWPQRPEEPAMPVWDLESAFRGLTPRSAKLGLVRRALKDSGADFQVLCTLDDIAWLTNLRGEDIQYNPLFLAFALVDDTRAELYAAAEAFNSPLLTHLEEDGWSLKPYRSFYTAAAAEPAYRKVFLTPETTNGALMEALGTREQVTGPSPTTLWKARKDSAELEGIRRAHRKDSRAMVRFMAWFASAAGREYLSEGSCAGKLRSFRAQEESFLGESFETIPGWKDHGAIIHYGLSSAEHPEGAALSGRGLFLLDSGAQYLEGTTDVTRTLVIGEPTPEEKADYTAVLRGHLALGRIPFSKGTRGYQLDGMTRSYLWAEGLNYGHGTGHGVGHVLGVHEGPQRINSLPVNIPLEVGMVLSNEPGVYRKGKHGIRIENLQVVTPGFTNEFGEFLSWETLTLVPYERRLIDLTKMTPEEIRQVDDYHARIRRELEGALAPQELKWLEEATRPLV